jgi:glycerate kinase
MFAQNRMGQHRTGHLSVCQDDNSVIRDYLPDFGESIAVGHTISYHGSVVSAICCPDKFRGSLTAAEAAAEMAAGLRAGGVAATELPLADGGEGTLDVLLAGGRRLTTRVAGPLGEPVDADWGLRTDGTAVIEMARASGLALVERNDPLRADTRGVGELLLAAVAEGATRAIVTLGGSASTDGGLGAVEALGGSLPLEVVCACDVDTRFVDAAKVFGPQKGATPEQVALLTRRLETLEVPDMPGAGAAGGLAGGLAALGAKLRSGFDVVAEAVGLRERLAQADLVVTGEGKLDASSLNGKVVGGVLRRTAKPVAVIAGYVDVELDAHIRVSSLTERAGSPERAMREAAALVRSAAFELATMAAHRGDQEPQWHRRSR